MRRGTARTCALVASAALSLAAAAQAIPPLLISYQGYATDAQGDPLPGPTESMTFRLCNAPVAGTCSWVEGPKSVTVVDGVFTTQLGDTTALSTSLFVNASALYLEVEIDGDVLAPRQRLVSAPYALECSNADTLQGFDAFTLGLVVESQALSDNQLNFPSGSIFSFDTTSGQSRFEFGNDLAVAGSLAVGQQTVSDTLYSSFSVFGFSSDSGALADTSDVLIEGDLELGGAAYLSGQLYLNGSASAGQDGDQHIYFYDGNLRNGEALRWDDAEDRFELTNRLRVFNVLQAGGSADTLVRSYNAFANSTVVPESAAMDTSGDLFVSNQVEIGGTLYLSKSLYLEGNNVAGGGGDQSIFFYNGADRESEFIRFDDSDNNLWISDNLVVGSNTPPAPVDYNRFGSDDTLLPASTHITTANDMFVTDDLEVGNRLMADIVEITGGADFSEHFAVNALPEPPRSGLADGAEREVAPGTVVCIDPERPGELSVCTNAFDRTVAGVVSGAGGVATGMVMGQAGSIASGDVPVALSGRVYVKADANGAPIRPGDLLTTAALPGHASAVRDHARAQGAVLGKAMTALDSGQGLVLVLVSLQ